MQLHTIQPYRTEPLPPAALPSGFSFLHCCINRQILSPVFSRFFSFITPSTSFSSSSQSMAGEERKKWIFPIPYGHPLSAFNSPSLCASVFVCMSVFLCIVCVVNVWSSAASAGEMLEYPVTLNRLLIKMLTSGLLLHSAPSDMYST